MSVINKMLKDLEDRDQDQGADFDPSGAVYQAKEKSKMPLLLAAMFVVIIGLVAVVAWLMMGKGTSSIKPVDVAVRQQVTDKPSDKVPAPVPANNEQANATTLSNNTPASIQAPAPTSVSAPTPQVVQSKAQQPNETQTQQTNVRQPEIKDVEEEDMLSEFDDDEFFDDEFEERNAPRAQQNAQPEQPALKIEKSASNLTREQRIEKLMTKAQDSFDKGYISDAITQLEEVIASADNHVEARNLLAVAWYGRGELQQAINILNDGLNRYPNTEMWRLTAAKIFFKENEQQGAFTYLEADLAEASAEYYSMQGTLARQLKRFDKAESAYANLTRIEPEKGSWWLGYAIALDSQNKAELAKQSYQQAISKAGISPNSIRFAQQRIDKLQD